MELFCLHLPEKVKPHFTSFIPAAVWFAITTFLLVVPGSDIPQASFLDEIYFDKWVHIGLFSGLTFLTAWPFVVKNMASRKLLIKIGTSFIIYGVLMEFVQKYLALERSFDGWDMLADGTGCFLGFLVANNLRLRIINKKAKVYKK